MFIQWEAIDCSNGDVSLHLLKEHAVILLFFVTFSFSLRKFFIFLLGLILRGSGNGGWSALLISLSAWRNAVPKAIFSPQSLWEALATCLASQEPHAWSFSLKHREMFQHRPALGSRPFLHKDCVNSIHSGDPGTIHVAQTSSAGGWRKQDLSASTTAVVVTRQAPTECSV